MLTECNERGLHRWKKYLYTKQMPYVSIEVNRSGRSYLRACEKDEGIQERCQDVIVRCKDIQYEDGMLSDLKTNMKELADTVQTLAQRLETLESALQSLQNSNVVYVVE